MAKPAGWGAADFVAKIYLPRGSGGDRGVVSICLLL